MTVEAAIALGTLVAVTLAAVGAVLAVVAAVRCIDAAREAARLAARGEQARARVVAAELAPPGSSIELVVEGDDVRVEIGTAPVRLLPLRVSGRARAVLEPGASGGDGPS